DDENDIHSTASLRHRGLKDFSLQLLLSTTTRSNNLSSLSLILQLDVSNNELSTLPGIASLSNLEILCIRRNWFNALPSDIGQLRKLREIDASRNFLKPSNDSLRLDALKSLPDLKLLDVSLNQKCRTADHRKFIKESILSKPTNGDEIIIREEVDVLVTVWQEKMSKNGQHNCIGASAAQRNPNLLRSQLEPWGTVNLRRRLVRDFGQEPTHPALVDRAGVMERLLRCYQNEGLLHLDNNAALCNSNNSSEGGDLNIGVGKRRIIKIDGIPVRMDLLDSILEELRDWRGNSKRGGSSNNRERPSIKAECYLILRAPTAAPDGKEGNSISSTSKQEKRRQKKMEGNKKLWLLALQAMKETDPEFATRCSEIAVTFGFTGSPHIDRQNASPFYGLSLGNFTEGTGCVAVEISPRIVAEVNTQNRLGRVDGRYPHWVSNYDVGKEERFSLIYYDTLSAYQTPGPAIFKIP
ncbi:hypothetical protein ACHAXR_004489, partial [Thalassiosira sp. AJA248-18]